MFLFSFNESRAQHGLFSQCPVTLLSTSGARSSCAVSIHSALTPVRPWVCSAPDKLLCLQAALSSAPNIFSYFHPPHSLEEESVCPLMPVRQQLSTCRVMGRVPVKVTAVGSLHERIGPRFTLLPKQPLHLHRGKMWRWLSSVSNMDLSWMLESRKCLEKHGAASTGSTVGWHGCSSLFIKVASCVFLAEEN